MKRRVGGLFFLFFFLELGVATEADKFRGPRTFLHLIEPIAESKPTSVALLAVISIELIVATVWIGFAARTTFANTGHYIPHHVIVFASITS